MCRDHSQTTSRRQGAEALVPTARDQARSTSLLASDTLSLLPDQLGQNPSPAVGCLTCSGIFMKFPSETQNRGKKQVCHRVLLEEIYLTQQRVCLPSDTST